MGNDIDHAEGSPWKMMGVVAIVFAIFAVMFYMNYRDHQEKEEIAARMCAAHRLDFAYFNGNTIRCVRLNPDGVYDYSDYFVNWNGLEAIYGGE